MKLESMKHVLSAIKRCDVIIKNGQKHYVGLYYDKKNFDRPMVLFKCDWDFNYFLSKVLELMPVSCVENKPLARALFDNTDEGDFIDTIYFSAIAAIYMNLPNFNNEDKDDFDKELNRDVVTNLYQLEADICKSAENKFLQKEMKKENKLLSIDDTREIICNNITKIAEEYGMDYKVLSNTKKETDEFYLETIIEEYDFDLWLIVMVSIENQKIYVGNRCIFRCFDSSEIEIVVDYIKHLIQITNGKLKNDIKVFCEEFKLNPRIYGIAKNSIKTMLEINYNNTGIEYGINDSMKTQVMVFLNDIKDKSKMYEICITYNEFIRNPEAFKKLIDEPKELRKWNFWSRRKKYKQDYFKTI